MKYLLIETPESCETCPLRSYSNIALVCTPLRKIKEEDDVCPLKDLPDWKNGPSDVGEWGVGDWYDYGWNSCLERLEK